MLYEVITDRYRALREESLEREELVIETFEHIDKLKKQMYIQTKSYDDRITSYNVCYTKLLRPRQA